MSALRSRNSGTDCPSRKEGLHAGTASETGPKREEEGTCDGVYVSIRDQGDPRDQLLSPRETIQDQEPDDRRGDAQRSRVSQPLFRENRGEKLLHSASPPLFPSSTSVGSSPQPFLLPPAAPLASLRPASGRSGACSSSSRGNADKLRSRQTARNVIEAPSFPGVPDQRSRGRHAENAREGGRVRLARQSSLGRLHSSLRQGLLRSGLPVRIALETSEVVSLQPPPPLFLFLPRSSYLPQIVNECVTRFRFFLRPTQTRGVAGPERPPSPSFSCLGFPLDWRLPLGVSVDLLAGQHLPCGVRPPLWRDAGDAGDPAGSDAGDGAVLPTHEREMQDAGDAGRTGPTAKARSGRKRASFRRTVSSVPAVDRDALDLVAVCPPEACGAAVPLPWPLTFHFHSSPTTLARSASAGASLGEHGDERGCEKAGGGEGQTVRCPPVLLPPASSPSYEGWAAFESMFLNSLRQASYLLTGSAAAFHRLSKADELALLAAFRSADLAGFLEAIAPLQGGDPERIRGEAAGGGSERRRRGDRGMSGRHDQAAVHRLPVRLHFVTRGVEGCERESNVSWGQAVDGAEGRWGSATQAMGGSKNAHAVPLVMSMLMAAPVFAETPAGAQGDVRGLAGSGAGGGGEQDVAAASLEGERKKEGGREGDKAEEERERRQATSETGPMQAGQAASVSLRKGDTVETSKSARRACIDEFDIREFYTLGDLLHSTLPQLFPQKVWHCLESMSRARRRSEFSADREAGAPAERRRDRSHRTLSPSLAERGGREAPADVRGALPRREEEAGGKRESSEEAWFSGSEEADAAGGTDYSEDQRESANSEWEDEEGDDAHVDTTREIVAVRSQFRSRGCRVLVQGIEPMLETPLYWLWKNASCMDLFLHVVVVLPPTVVAPVMRGNRT
ncbi:putative autophagy protein [Toxoplasma gondii MAS]|uniref:Autophagy protein 5 n=1 Tax=Toxoplasma gondii MAS TaxID=943118 RepID=A0A086QY10_TOXGO|nr:putative autophagy protein [Toxoplasma gondii MAS]